MAVRSISNKIWKNPVVFYIWKTYPLLYFSKHYSHKTNITWYTDIEVVAISSCTVYHICSICSVILTAIAHLLIQEAIFHPECEIVNILITANSKRLLIVKSTDSLIGHKVWLILTLHKKWWFPLMISLVNVTKFQKTADLVTFTEEILNGKLHFLCSAKNITLMKTILKEAFNINV